MSNLIKQILTQQGNLTPTEIDELIEEAREALFNYLDEGDQDSAEYVCQEYFGLEPDYLDELL